MARTANQVEPHRVLRGRGGDDDLGVTSVAQVSSSSTDNRLPIPFDRKPWLTWRYASCAIQARMCGTTTPIPTSRPSKNAPRRYHPHPQSAPVPDVALRPSARRRRPDPTRTRSTSHCEQRVRCHVARTGHQCVRFGRFRDADSSSRARFRTSSGASTREPCHTGAQTSPQKRSPRRTLAYDTGRHKGSQNGPTLYRYAAALSHLLPSDETAGDLDA